MSTTATQPDFLTEYAEGFAQLLAGAGIGLSWKAIGSGSPIHLVSVPTTPDQVVILTPSPTDAHPTLTDSGVNLQIRYRAGADVRQVWAMRGAVRSVLQGRFPVRLPTGVYVSSLVLAYGGGMGVDKANRQEFSDNYRTRAAERTA